MLNGKKIVVVIPAYNAERTLEATYNNIPLEFVDEIVLVDDCSVDKTYQIARERLSIEHTIKLDINSGYGANQKHCYQKALSLQADIILMLHGDYQYDPRLIPSMVSMIAYDVYDVVLGSRILGNNTLAGRMPRYKYLANRILTFVQNIMLNSKLSEFHTGLRAYKASCLTSIPYEKNSNGFVFDNELLAQLIHKNYKIGEVSCPTKYFEDASSISFKNSVVYGFGVLRVSTEYLLNRLKLKRSRLFT